MQHWWAQQAGLGYLALIQAKILSNGVWAHQDVWTLVRLRLALPIGEKLLLLSMVDDGPVVERPMVT